MTEQIVFSIVAASVGFVAAIFFCIGNAMNTSSKILLQATPFWDFSEPAARALASQRAQYATGAMLLVISFALQVAATLASPTRLVVLPQWLGTWQYLVLFVFVLTGALCAPLSFCLYKKTITKILLQVAKELEEEKKAAEMKK